MILTRSTRLSQPQGPVEISPDFGGLGVVYLPNVQSNINRVAGTVGRGPTPQGVSAVYTAGFETKIERLNGSAPNGVTEFTQIVYLTPIAGGAVNDRGIFGNWNTTGATGLVQMVHRARDATTNGRYCYVVSYDPTSGATSAGIRTSDYSAVDNVPAVLVATVKNNTLSLYLNGVLHNSTAVAAVAMSSQADLQIGNYYDNTAGRRLSAKVHLAAFLPRGLGGSEVAALSRNPWQLFRPVQRRVYFDMGAGGGGTTHTVTADPVDQGSTTTRPGLTQTHVTTASAVAQGATVSRPAVTQVHVVTARAVAQGSTVNAPAVEVGSITVVTARPVVQSSTVNAPSIVQTHALTARPSVQGATVTRPGLNQTHTVTARAVTQSSVVNAPSVDVGSTPATFVTARPVAQGSTVNAPGIRQTHVTSAREVVQRSTINAPGLVQAHVVAARPVVQAGSVNKPWVTTGSGTFTGLSPADLAAIRAAVRAELHAELTAIFQIQTKVDAAL